MAFTSFSGDYCSEKKPLNNNPFPLLARMKDFVDIDVSSRRKNIPLTKLMISNSSKIALTKKNAASVGKKSVCICWIKDIQKKASTIRKEGFLLKKCLKKSKKIGVY